MAEQIQGKITQIIGAVLDIKFPEGKLPKIYDAIHIAAPDGGVLPCFLLVMPHMLRDVSSM